MTSSQLRTSGSGSHFLKYAQVTCSDIRNSTVRGTHLRTPLHSPQGRHPGNLGVEWPSWFEPLYGPSPQESFQTNKLASYSSLPAISSRCRRQQQGIVFMTRKILEFNVTTISRAKLARRSTRLQLLAICRLKELTKEDRAIRSFPAFPRTRFASRILSHRKHQKALRNQDTHTRCDQLHIRIARRTGEEST